jgi:hypothetical protein
VPKAIRAANDLPEPLRGRTFYEADEHAWIAAQISALNEGHFNRLDRTNLAAYLTDMTIRDRRELQSRLTVLLQHLLKIRMQRSRLTRSWIGTVLEQQREIRAIVVGIPSLGRQADVIAALAYPDAVRAAAREIGIAAEKFPATSPWTVDQALAFDPPEPARAKPRT